MYYLHHIYWAVQWNHLNTDKSCFWILILPHKRDHHRTIVPTCPMRKSRKVLYYRVLFPAKCRLRIFLLHWNDPNSGNPCSCSLFLIHKSDCHDSILPRHPNHRSPSWSWSFYFLLNTSIRCRCPISSIVQPIFIIIRVVRPRFSDSLFVITSIMQNKKADICSSYLLAKTSMR